MVFIQTGPGYGLIGPLKSTNPTRPLLEIDEVGTLRRPLAVNMEPNVADRQSESTGTRSGIPVFP